MKLFFCMVIGYMLGSISPSAFLSKVKKKNLRNEGTGNLGATNAMLVFGKWYGIAVMFFDIMKAFVSVKLAGMLMPDYDASQILAGASAMAGHIYPFYLGFKGGKGLACFGGMILALSSDLFIELLVLSTVCMIVINYTVAMPVSAAIFFPLIYGFRVDGVMAVFAILLSSILLTVSHFPNIARVADGKEATLRECLKLFFRVE